MVEAGLILLSALIALVIVLWVAELMPPAVLREALECPPPPPPTQPLRVRRVITLASQEAAEVIVSVDEYRVLTPRESGTVLRCQLAPEQDAWMRSRAGF